MITPLTDAQKIKDQITHNLHTSNKFQSKQNSRLNNATGILSQMFIQNYIILNIVTVQVMAWNRANKFLSRLFKINHNNLKWYFLKYNTFTCNSLWY